MKDGCDSHESVDAGGRDAVARDADRAARSAREHETDENMQRALDALEQATMIMRNLQVVRAGGAPIPEEMHQPIIRLAFATIEFATVLYDLPPRELFDLWFKSAPDRQSWEDGMVTLRRTYTEKFVPLLEAEMRAEGEGSAGDDVSA